MTLFDPNPFDDEESTDPVLAAAREAERQARHTTSRQESDRYPGPPSEAMGQDEAAEWEAWRQQNDLDRRAKLPSFNQGPGGSFALQSERQQREGKAPRQLVASATPASSGRKMARDGQSLLSQSWTTQASFRTLYGDQAEERWVEEHEAELDGRPKPSFVPRPIESAAQGTQSATVRPATSPTAAPSVGEQGSPSMAPTALPGRPQAAAPASTTPSSAASESPDDEVVIQNNLDGRQLRVRRNLYGTQFRSEDWTIVPQRQTMSRTEPLPRERWSIESDPITSVRPDEKPVDAVVRLSGKSPEQSRTVLEGIGALVRGDPSGAWTEPYLNDTARLAWARQEQAAGRNVDPRDAPLDYIESWKDSFFGSDHSVPLVKELDQQLIDASVDRFGGPAQGRPFNWKQAFGESGENGLISQQVASNDCGPNAFSVILRSRGYNADPAQAFSYARQRGYHDGEQFTGPYNMARMLREEAGIQATAAPLDWGVIDAELDAGRPVLLSSGGHYWAVSSRRDSPTGPEYYAGSTAAVVSNPEWAKPGALRYGGAPNVMILARGEVDPNARVVQALGLKPPTGSGPDRTLLSAQTNQVVNQNLRSAATRSMANQAQLRPDGTNEWSQIAWNLAEEEGADPVWVQAILGQESGGDPNTPDSYQGARGPMQLMPAAAAEVGVNRDDPVDNTRGGIRYFKKMLDRYDGNIDLALAAYNAGPGAVDQYGGIPPYEETQRYVRDVKARYQALLNRYAKV